nr:DUF2750 domain-containing protein [Geodermatophilus sabuli]
MAAHGGLWGWGDDDGLVPWTGDDGHDLVPLWTGAEQAQTEAGDGGDPGEAPVFLDLEDLLAAVPDWLAAGVTAAGLQSVGGRFQQTVPLAELTERILSVQVTGRP